MKKTSKTPLILIFLITLLTLYLVNSKLIITSILNYTELFITKLFPTSFLIYVVAALLINYQIIEELSKLTKNPSTFYVILMSLISGFPSGPKYIKELYEKNYLTRTTSNYLLKFTHFPNPLFILGSINILLNSPTLAIKILTSLILSNFIIAIFSYKKDITIIPLSSPSENFSKALSTAITSSFKLQLLIYGTNLFFYLISVIITTYLKTSPLIYILINGSFDLIKGIFSITLLSNELLKCILIIFFISFGSISIHIQIKSILSDTSLNYKSFLHGRLIATPLAIIIFIILYNL